MQCGPKPGTHSSADIRGSRLEPHCTCREELAARLPGTSLSAGPLRRNLILLLSNRLARRGQFRPTAAAQISPSCAAFPLRPDGGRKDSKGSRVVEKECASRSFFLVTVT